jgi:hydroxymethylpyrimidine/phosphomethylpyrimidine kinase
VARELAGRSLPLVVDPVMAAKNGTSLLGLDAIEAAIQELFPLASLLTPNLDEATVLLGRPVRTPEQMREAAAELRERYRCGAVLVKGGHLDGYDLVDILCDIDGFGAFSAPRLATPHTRGTGCTYSAAITAHLARGLALREAVSCSRLWLQDAIRGASAAGRGRGGLDHFA